MDGLIATLRTVAPALGLQPMPSFVKRCVQAFDMLEARHGVMVLGAAGAGKTSCVRVSPQVTLRARWVTLRARWATLRARWVTLRAC